MLGHVPTGVLEGPTGILLEITTGFSEGSGHVQISVELGSVTLEDRVQDGVPLVVSLS